MPPLPYTRPLIKISGEALMGSGRYGIDLATLDAIAADLAGVCRQGISPSVVVGGGNIFRGLAGVASGMDRVKGDFMGMLATVMNGLALEQTLNRLGQPGRGLFRPARAHRLQNLFARRGSQGPRCG